VQADDNKAPAPAAPAKAEKPAPAPASATVSTAQAAPAAAAMGDCCDTTCAKPVAKKVLMSPKTAALAMK
jgi:hypothetical protein